jgi:hypothetical protein
MVLRNGTTTQKTTNSINKSVDSSTDFTRKEEEKHKRLTPKAMWKLFILQALLLTRVSIFHQS